MPQNIKKAIILLSGGLDSATAAAIARAEGFECYALSFDYGQRHRSELEAAKRVAQSLNMAEHKILPLKLPELGNSALTNHAVPVTDATDASDAMPVTYVPGRNLIFLSLAVAWGEVLGAGDIYIGANQVDYSGYPDCRGEFLTLFEKTANSATCVEEKTAKGKIRIQAPLLNLKKFEIIRRGIELKVDYALTVSCYRADIDGRACGRCDACFYRKQGFADAGVADPTPYVSEARLTV